MAIRCAAKALIVKDGCILLNRCRHTDGRVYYDLPGGGQHQYESVEDAVLREVREETGIDIRILRFAALAEEIYTDEGLRQKYPDYSHRMMHIFLAQPVNETSGVPSEKDWGMEESEWISLDCAESLPEVRPMRIKDCIRRIVDGGETVYLGTEYVDWKEE